MPEPIKLKLSEDQLDELARITYEFVKRCMGKFYEDPKNREAFEKWKKERELEEKSCCSEKRMTAG